jgi:hypothetical protein
MIATSKAKARTPPATAHAILAQIRLICLEVAPQPNRLNETFRPNLGNQHETLRQMCERNGCYADSEKTDNSSALNLPMAKAGGF